MSMPHFTHCIDAATSGGVRQLCAGRGAAQLSSLAWTDKQDWAAQAERGGQGPSPQ